MGVFPIGLLCFFVFFVVSIVIVIKILRNAASKYNLAIIAGFLLFSFALTQLPFPSYVDGMQKRVEAELTKEQLFRFAHDANAQEYDWLDEDKHSKWVERLRSKHNKALSLSKLPPRIIKGNDYVSVFYGSALVKHWGYIVGDIEDFPIEHIPENMQRKVYDGVWVYHDIW